MKLDDLTADEILERQELLAFWEAGQRDWVLDGPNPIHSFRFFQMLARTMIFLLNMVVR